MKTKFFSNRWYGAIRSARDVLIQKVGVIMCLALLLVLLLVSQSAARQPASPVTPAAVGDNAVALPGLRPGVPDLSGYVQVPYDAALNPSGGQMTIEAWVKRVAYDRNEMIVGNGWQTSYWLGFSSGGYQRLWVTTQTGAAQGGALDGGVGIQGTLR